MSGLERWRLHRQGAEPGTDFTAETFDPIRHGLPLAEAQRRGTGDAVHGAAIAGRHLVGGALWLAVVDREGTRQDAIHEWPDAVGEATEALELIAAGFSKATAAMERAARAGSPAVAPLPGLGAPLQPQALALGRGSAPGASIPPGALPAFLAGRRIGGDERRPVPARPLRPGDLGALPALGRP